MNENVSTRLESLGASVEVARPPVSRRTLIISLVAAVALVATLVVVRANRKAAVPAALPPLVTALAPGRSPYVQSASFTGAIVARYDMPIGIDGEGGRVAAILVEAGDTVRRGQVLARLDTSVLAPQVASLRAALDQSRAEAVLAEAEFHRAEAISASMGALSKAEVDKRRSQLATANARVKASEAQLAEAEARLHRTELRAPDDGVVLTRAAEVGQAVTAGTPPLFRLARGAEVEMKAMVAEQDLPSLKIGQTAEVSVTGVATPFTGKIRLLPAVIDPQSRLGEVRVSLPRDRNLRPGAFAHGVAQVGQDVRPIVPQTAFLADSRGSYVYIIGKDNRVERRAVRFGGTQPSGIVIAEGLDGSERVVTTAGAFLHAGEEVRVDTAKATP